MIINDEMTNLCVYLSVVILQSTWSTIFSTAGLLWGHVIHMVIFGKRVPCKEKMGWINFECFYISYWIVSQLETRDGVM